MPNESRPDPGNAATVVLARIRSEVSAIGSDVSALPSRIPPLKWLLGAGGLLLVAVIVAALLPLLRPGPARPAHRAASLGGVPAASKPAADLGLAFVPEPGATSVSVLDPVSVRVKTGSSLDSVTLVAAGGDTVAGNLTADHLSWTSGGRLDYATRYTLTATVTTSGGTPVRQSSTFTTVRPANLTMPYLRANAGLLLANRSVYGVGQPIEVVFDEPIPDRAAAEKALHVQTDPPVQGAWHWFSDREAHWRPQAYWTTGTRVTVTADVYGRDLGRGLYGQANSSASFTIGPSHVAIADDRTFQIMVYFDGQLVRDIPTAMGLHTTIRSPDGKVIDLRTHSGVHVVLDKETETRMTSASYGLTGPAGYDEMVHWTTHLTYSGEYVHAAPWSVAQQGHQDASHGCLNVSTDNAIWFYNQFIPGDVVDVRNTGRPMDTMDGLGDWNISWDKWVAGSALS